MTEQLVTLQPGVKIKAAGGLGTLGMLVYKYTQTGGPRSPKVVDYSEVYLLTCWHVLYRDGRRRSGQVTLPDHNDMEIATYSHSNDTAIEGLDAAIAKIKSDIPVSLTNRVLGSRKVIKKTGRALKSMKLRKRGAATQNTACLVNETDRSFGNIELALTLKHRQQNGGSSDFCAPGDSGAIWWETARGRAVGLHARGGLANEEAAAAVLKEIMKRLKLTAYEPTLLEAPSSVTRTSAEAH
ncbi:MAG: hypothetical protein AAF420_01610 [Pseudomonadota bacterium]